MHLPLRCARAVLLPSLLLCLVGCPEAPPPAETPTPGPAETPPSRERPASAPIGAPEETPAPVPSQQPAPPPAAPETPAAAPRETPPWEPPPGRDQRFEPGTVARCARDLAVGLVSVRGPEHAPVARFSVAAGQVAYHVLLGVGDELRAGEARLQVGAIEGKTVHARWLAEYPDPLSEAKIIQEAPSESPARLAPQGLYALPDGRVLGVGNPRRSQVALSLYPPGYEERPTQSWDLWLKASPPQVFEGQAGTLALHAIDAGGTWVELSW